MSGLELKMTPEKMQERLKQASEMADIWDHNSDPVNMYLKGCIVTAAALSNVGQDGSRKENNLC